MFCPRPSCKTTVLHQVWLLCAIVLHSSYNRTPDEIIKSFSDVLSTPGAAAALDKVHGQGGHLIFDVGRNNGRDAVHFAERGYTVVAVDANPQHVAAVQDNNEDLVKEGKLVVLHAGIEENTEVPLTFYRNVDNDVMSSFEEKKACESGRCEEIQVPMMRCEGLWAFGKPLYLKVDIEERHYACIRSLRNIPADMLPVYVSWEMHEMAEGKPFPLLDIQLVTMLYNLGYINMKLVLQDDGAQTIGWPEEVNHVSKEGESPDWVLVPDALQQGILNPRSLPNGGAWADFVMRLDGATAAAAYKLNRHRHLLQ